MRNKIELLQSGLKCDNPSCDWQDKTIPHTEYINHVIHNTMTYVIHKDKKKIIEVLEWVEINGKMHPKSKKTTYFKSEDKPDFGQKN